MNTKIITTNLRIPEEDLSLARVLAAEKGISVNEYIRNAIRIVSTKEQLGILSVKPDKSVYDFLLEFANRKIKKGKKMELSDEDKAIYDL